MTGHLIKRKTRQHPSSPAEMLAKRISSSKNLFYYSAVNCSMCKVAVHQQPIEMLSFTREIRHLRHAHVELGNFDALKKNKTAANVLL
jgi:hypothetical protein